jgi:hypothetical protein
MTKSLASILLVRRKGSKSAISVLTDRIEVKFFVHEDWRAQDAVDSLDAKLISSIDAERLGAVWIQYRQQPTWL